MRNRWLRLSLLWCCLCLPGWAERLPVHQYTIADGLPQGSVRAIHQDARGFLWLATAGGVSRFDGYRFTNYGVQEGLGDAAVWDVVSDRRGRLWVATVEGVSLLLNEKEAVQQGRKFQNFPVVTNGRPEEINSVLRILFDAENRMWCVTEVGIYRARSIEVAAGQFELVSELVTADTPPQMLMDRHGRIWVSINERLWCFAGGNVTTHQPWQQVGETKGNPHLRWVKGLVELADGRIILATNKDLYEFSEPTANQRGTWRRLPFTLPSPNLVGTIHPAADGGLWIGSDAGLIGYRDGQQVTYRLGNDPNPFIIVAFLSDRQGNLWIGTRQRGLLKLKGESVLVYDASDGLLPVMDVYWTRETHDQCMTLSGRPVSPLACNETFLTTTNGGLTHLQPPPSLCAHDVLQDSRKNWWVLRWLPKRNTYKLRFIPGPELNFSAGYELTAADGWVDGSYSTLYEDDDGYVWLREVKGRISRIEYVNGERPRIVEMVKAGVAGNAVFFLRDPSGALWWTNGGTVWRQQHGKIETITLGQDGVRPRSFFADRKGRLWISTINAGVFMTDAPNVVQPRFVNYTTAHGLLHNQVEAMSEDDAGRIWFGTVRGLCWLDVASGRFSPFSFDESGLGTAVRDLHKDERGYLWASVIGAVVRINPKALPQPASQLPVYLNRVSLAGEPLAVGETGAVSLPPLELTAERNNLSIEFLNPNFRDENAVQYQYKLDGVDTDWSAPGNVREVNYARLAPGSYRFLARAVSDTGAVSAEAASLPFVILRPLWQRWWFLTLLAMTLGLLVYGAYRYRVAQIVAMERVRLRIAADLHDDVGANLSLIAGVSEMLTQQAAPGLQTPLAQIAEASRRSMDAMSDIVWMINPSKDHLSDLTQRMRRFASETLSARNIEFQFATQGLEEEFQIGDETRRELFLLFKEAINNSARHAHCTRVEVALSLHNNRIHLTIKDNGIGFDPSHANGGNGLSGMRDRVGKLGGELAITSAQGHGTEITVELPSRR